MSDPYLNKESVPYINARERFRIPPKAEPKVDEVVSHIVGKKVYANDQRLIKLVIKYKKDYKNKGKGDDEDDEFFKDRRFLDELKEIFK